MFRTPELKISFPLLSKNFIDQVVEAIDHCVLFVEEQEALRGGDGKWIDKLHRPHAVFSVISVDERSEIPVKRPLGPVVAAKVVAGCPVLRTPESGKLPVENRYLSSGQA